MLIIARFLRPKPSRATQVANQGPISSLAKTAADPDRIGAIKFAQTMIQALDVCTRSFQLDLMEYRRGGYLGRYYSCGSVPVSTPSVEPHSYARTPSVEPHSCARTLGVVPHSCTSTPGVVSYCRRDLKQC